jgi:hypothetical protein
MSPRKHPLFAEIGGASLRWTKAGAKPGERLTKEVRVMRRSRFRRYALPAVVLVVLVAVGVASTNAISFTSGQSPYKDVGYGAITTNAGVAISNVHYVTANAGQEITEIDVTFGAALQPTDVVGIAFNQDGQTGGTSTTCTDAGAQTTYDCTGLTQSVAGLTDVDFAVTPGT